MEEDNKTVNIDAAKQTIDADRQQRVKSCGEELQAVMAKYGCSLHSHQEWVDGTPKGPSQIIIVADR